MTDVRGQPHRDHSPIAGARAARSQGWVMDAPIDVLVHRNLMDVFNERDRARRREAIAEVYVEDVEFTDPDGTLTGRDAVDAKVQELLDGAPGLVFSPAGPARRSGDLALLPWRFGPPGQPPVVSGLDVSRVREGRIVSVHTFLDTEVAPR